MTKAKKTKFLKAIGENKHLERYLELIPEDIQKKLNAEQIATLCAINSASFERGVESSGKFNTRKVIASTELGIMKIPDYARNAIARAFSRKRSA